MEKNKQKQILLDIMNEDAENGVYDNIPFNADNIKQKPFNIALVRDIMDYYDLSEISFSRMVEMLNEIAIKWHENHIGYTNKMVEHHIVDTNKMINMTPKEKALNLIDRFENYSFEDIEQTISAFSSAKQCALIAVDEILNIRIVRRDDWADDYWSQVKQEIEKL